MQKILNIESHSEEQTYGLAAKLATTCFVTGDVLILSGQLGAGKTAFVRGLACGLGLDETAVNSPSYTLVNEYPGTRSLYHFDLYRMKEISEMREIGWEEYLTREGVIAIEWGEKIIPILTTSYYLLDFTLLGEKERRIDIAYYQ